MPRALGFFYVAYLSLILSLFSSVTFRIRALPVADELVGWLGQNLPPLKVTREGIEMGVKEPTLLSHPRWGPLLYLDPVSEFPKSPDLEKAFVMITHKHVAYRNLTSGEYRIQSLLPKTEPRKWQDLVITGNGLARNWQRLKPFFNALFFVVAFVGTYLWKLLGGFFYSLVGLLVNLFRPERLPYRSILDLAFFVLTPVTWLQVLSLIFPAWRLPLNMLTSLLITSLYLTLAILGTQPSRLQQE